MPPPPARLIVGRHFAGKREGVKHIILFGFCAVLLVSPANVRSETVQLATNEWIPYTSAHLDGYGFFTKIVTDVLKDMGVEADYVFYPWRRCYESVLDGKVWAAFPYSYTESRASQVLYSDVISFSISSLFYYKGTAGTKSYKFNSLDDLRNYAIGGVKGYFYEEKFIQAGLKVDYSPTEISAVEKLRLGRIELLPINKMVGWDLIKKNFPDDIDNFGTLEKPLSRNALHLIVSKRRPGARDLLNRFNIALKSRRDRGLVVIEPN